MKKWLAVFGFGLATALTGCGSEESYIDSDLKLYVDEIAYLFQTECNVDPTPIYNQVKLYELRDLEFMTLGYCKTGDVLSSNEIYIDHAFFYNLKDQNTDYAKLQILDVLAHEIGHCAYNLGHSDNKDNMMYYPFSSIDNYETFLKNFKNMCADIKQVQIQKL